MVMPIDGLPYLWSYPPLICFYSVCPLLAESPINALKEMSCYKVVYKQGLGLCISWDFECPTIIN